LLKIASRHCCKLAIENPKLDPAATYLGSVVFAVLNYSCLVAYVGLVARLSVVSSSVIFLLDGWIQLVNAAVILELEVGQF
jgi:hypothetical protein